MSQQGSNGFLSGIKALLLEQGLGKTRVSILAKQLEKHGGEVLKTLSQSTTHILVGTNTRLARVPVLLKTEDIPESVSVVRADWLSSCLTKRQIVSEEGYKVHPEYSPATAPAARPKQQQPQVCLHMHSRSFACMYMHKVNVAC